jgi:hypothetical protein
MSTHQPAAAQLIFRLFKYTVYTLLTYNIYLFFQEEWLATEQTFSQGVILVDLISGFAATIDTAAWVVLLLLFELETSVIDDRVLRQPRVKFGFIALRVVSYSFILYAFYGYFDKMLLTYDISPFALEAVVDNLCALVGQGYASIITLDEYPLLDAQTCVALNGQDLYRLNGQQVIGTLQDWQAVQWLAWVDVINSITWVGVVIILEVDVWLQLQGRFQGRLVTLSNLIKALFYGVLFAAAAYWGVLGDFLDFWDAFMWLVAFVFIEMNLFRWQAETSSE